MIAISGLGLHHIKKVVITRGAADDVSWITIKVIDDEGHSYEPLTVYPDGRDKLELEVRE